MKEGRLICKEELLRGADPKDGLRGLSDLSSHYLHFPTLTC